MQGLCIVQPRSLQVQPHFIVFLLHDCFCLLCIGFKASLAGCQLRSQAVNRLLLCSDNSPQPLQLCILPGSICFVQIICTQLQLRLVSNKLEQVLAGTA